MFHLNDNHFFPLCCKVWRPHRDRPASDRRGPSRSTELIFNQDFQGLFIYIIILALGCGDHGGVGEIIVTFRFMKNWGMEKKRKWINNKKETVTLRWGAGQSVMRMRWFLFVLVEEFLQKHKSALMCSEIQCTKPGLKSEGPLLGRIWHDFFFSFFSLNSLSLTVFHSVPQVLAGLRVSDITPQQPNQRKMDSQRFVDLFNSISFSFFPPFFFGVQIVSKKCHTEARMAAWSVTYSQIESTSLGCWCAKSSSVSIAAGFAHLILNFLWTLKQPSPLDLIIIAISYTKYSCLITLRYSRIRLRCFIWIFIWIASFHWVSTTITTTTTISLSVVFA